jgi:hypothetical protein
MRRQRSLRATRHALLTADDRVHLRAVGSVDDILWRIDDVTNKAGVQGPCRARGAIFTKVIARSTTR